MLVTQPHNGIIHTILYYHGEERNDTEEPYDLEDPHICWFPTLISFFISLKEPFSLRNDLPEEFSFLKESNTIFRPYALDGDYKDKEWDLAHIELKILNVLVPFLMVLNKEKIITRAPQRSFKQKNYKKNKLPFYDYKVLDIKIPEKRLGYDEIIKEKNKIIKKRYHSVRGHKKTYTADKPLFGKYVGTIEVPEHNRGDKNLGTIEKEYKISKRETKTGMVKSAISYLEALYKKWFTKNKGRE
jgi:hypothetical protein